jgi:hypothetical protein
MRSAKGGLHQNAQQVNELGVIDNHMTNTMPASERFGDLPRSQIVNSATAFEKLTHELNRMGMVRVLG